MIAEWFAASPALLAAIVVVFVPGLLALYGAGLRGLALAAFAPVFGVAATAVTAVVFGQFGIPWAAGSWSLAMVVFIGLAWLLGKVLGKPESPKRTRPTWLLPAGIALGVLFAGWRLISYIGDPGSISQTNDAVFHMNALRFALEAADASSLHVNAVIGGRSFYPAAWHGIATLIVLFTGVSIPIAANTLTVVIGALIWPLGIAWLARSVFGSNAVAAYAAVLASALQTFPLLMFQWGVLFPNALSIALIPAGLAMVVTGSTWVRTPPRWQGWVRLSLFLVVTVAALLLAQPAAFLPWGAMSAVWLTYLAIRRVAATGRWSAVAIAAACWALLAVVWFFLAGSTSGSHWPPFRGNFEVLWDILLNSQLRIPAAYAVSALMLIGLVAALRRRELRWFAVAWGGISLLYVLVAAVDSHAFRGSVLGAWYADPYRIAALAPIVVIPLAAFGLDSIVRLVARKTGRADDVSSISGVGLAVAVVLMVLIISLRGVAMPAYVEGTFDRDSRYVAAEDAYLNPDERELLEELPEYVDEEERVLGNPSTGAAFGYFLSGIDVFPRTWSPPRTDDWLVIADGLRDAADDSSVCDALAVYGDPDYVVDFGASEEGPGMFAADGMTGFEGREGFELVARTGSASLWRITACEQ